MFLPAPGVISVDIFSILQHFQLFSVVGLVLQTSPLPLLKVEVLSETTKQIHSCLLVNNNHTNRNIALFS